MNPILRWLRFNLVGAMGMAVQLAALALLNRWLRGHYLVASAVALELTLLHNFAWHLHYTWRDRAHVYSFRPCKKPRHSERSEEPLYFVPLLVRFHLSHGLVSLLGNLVLMRLLVHGAHLPVVAANLIAILCCSLVNFGLGNLWTFATPHKAIPIQTLSLTLDS